MARYTSHLMQLRKAFPQPVSDQEHDAWFVFSVLRALDRLDAMKSHRPVLGEPRVIDFSQAAAARIPDELRSVEEVTRELVDHFGGMFIWGHPRSQVNVINPPCIPGILGTLLPAIYNPNLCSEEASRGIAYAEVEVIAMTARLMGLDPQLASGVFTFGGTGTLLYAIRAGIARACPEADRHGLRGDPPVVICSDQAHYANSTAAAWMGLGTDNVVRIPADSASEMRICLLETELRRLLKEGRRVACIVATMGTTDAFGLDDLRGIHELRDRMVDEFLLDYVPHIHADAVIGWAWSVFHDYDFASNPLEFPDRTVRSLAAATRRIRHLHLADSIGIDYHKTGFAPYVSSAFVVRHADTLKLLARDRSLAPYLFQSGDYNPGQYTLETTRGGSGPMSALGALSMLGKTGLRSLLGHLVTMAEILRNRLTAHPAISVMNADNAGPVTLFRVYPDGVDTFDMPRLEQSDASYHDQLQRFNAYNRRLFEIIHEEALRGEGVVISMTDRFRESSYGAPVVALKSYIMSPFSEAQYVQAVVDSIERARQRLANEESV